MQAPSNAYICAMYTKNSLKATAIRYCMFVCLYLAPHVARAQGATDSLEVYKITFTSTEKPVSSQKPVPSMTVTYNPEFLSATQSFEDGNKTSWLIWHEKRKILQIDGQQGLPLNYERQLKTNVYLPGESTDSTTRAAAVVRRGEWDNENEYNGPGTGKINLTEDTLTIAGYPTHKAEINYTYPPACKDGLISRITVWYSPGLPPFFLPPFTCLQKIPGAALMISIETADGAKTSYKATDVTQQLQPVSFFRPSKDIGILYPPELN